MVLDIYRILRNVSLACNDNCTGVLLDTVDMLSHELAEGTSHIANGYIPPPWEDLSYIDKNTTAFIEEIELQNKLKQRMKSVPWHEHRKLLKQVELLLRTVRIFVKLWEIIPTFPYYWYMYDISYI